MAVGDGAYVRFVLDAVDAVLRIFASPTRARGSVLLMTGGLVVLGFLFLAFLFRSAIVGDLAPHAARARPRMPRARLPTEQAARTRVPASVPPPTAGFHEARAAGRMLSSHPTLDALMEGLIDHGCDARVTQSGATRKRVRLYTCASCSLHAASAQPADCERERGLLAGGFEALTGQLAKVEEVACARAGAKHCEFEVRHQASVTMRRGRA